MNQEKLALTSEISSIYAQLMTDEELANLNTATENEYSVTLSNISEGYEVAVSEAADLRDKAISEANEAIEAAKQAYAVRVEELSASKAEYEKEATTYYEQLKAHDNKTITKQMELRELYAQKKARLAEIETEEALEKAQAEAAAKRAAEEAAAKKAAEEAAARQAARRPLIKF